MSKMSIARPYAKAILLTAKTSEDLALWSKTLGFLSKISLLPEVSSLFNQRAVTKKNLAELFLAVGNIKLSDYAKNLIQLLAERQRLKYLPEIARIFEDLRNEKENKIQVEIKSAVALPEHEMQTIADIFQKALSRQVEIKNEIDPALVGGFIAHAGNYVLNNSLLNRLVELKEVMGG